MLDWAAGIALAWAVVVGIGLAIWSHVRGKRRAIEALYPATECEHVVLSDYSQCQTCPTAWDTNDPDPPPCPFRLMDHDARAREAKRRR